MKIPAFLHLWGRSSASPFSPLRLIRRACVVLAASVCGFVLLALAALLSLRFDGFLRRSAFFALAEIRVSGASAPLERDIRTEISRLASHGHGNLALLRLSRARYEIESLPRVRSARLEKVHPRTLAVTVEERQPVAVVAGGQGLLWLDREGYLLGPADSAEIAAAHAPVVTGLQLERPLPGERLDQPMLAETLSAIALLNENDPALARRFAEWHLSPEEGITGILAEGVEVRFGPADPLLRIPDLVTAMQRKPDWDRFTYFDLRFDSQVVYF